MTSVEPDEQIGVIVVTHNSERYIVGLLDSLPQALGSVAADVVIVDNGSCDRTRDLLFHRRDCRVVVAPNNGYAAGINRGIAATPAASAWLVLNPDLTLDPGSVPRLMEALKAPRVGIVGPRILDGEGRLQPSMRREPTLGRALGLSFTGHPALSESVDDPQLYTAGRCADWLLGAALLISSSCAERVGRWDESFFLYSEETDYCLRARDAGWTCWFEPGAVMRHVGGGSGQSGATHAMQILNRVRLYRRRNGPVASLAYYLLTVLSELSWLARGHRHSATSLAALIRPGSRPSELHLSPSFIPK